MSTTPILIESVPQDAPPARADSPHAEPGTAAANSAPLNNEQMSQIAEARRRRKRLDKAAAVAAFNGWTAAVFAVLALPFAPFSTTALVMALAMGAIAYHEFKGRRLFQQLSPKAPRLLGWNQIALAAVLVCYGLWNINAALTGPSPYAEHIAANDEVASILGPIDELHTLIAIVVYGSVIVLSIVFQGATAWYYFSRLKHLRAYVQETPDWVVELQKHQ